MVTRAPMQCGVYGEAGNKLLHSTIISDLFLAGQPAGLLAKNIRP